MFKRDDWIRFSICFIIFICCIMGFYFGYWVKRPIYSLSLIHKAILNKDTVSFERYFDMDSVYNNLFDDTIGKVTQEDKDTSVIGMFGKALAAGLLNSIKPVFIENNKELTLRFVKDELYEISDKDSSNIYVTANNALYTIRKSINSSNLKLKDYEYLSKTDDNCILELFILNKTTNDVFSYKVQLHRLYDGKWKVVKVFNTDGSIVNANNKKLDVLPSTNNPSSLVKNELKNNNIENNNPLEFKMSLDKRKKASNRIREILVNADNIVQKDGKTSYQFNRKINQPLSNDYLLLRNLIEIDNKTNEISSVSMFIVIRYGKSLPDWNNIVLFNDDKVAYTIDVNQWEKDSKGKYINLGVQNERGMSFYNINFGSKLSCVADMFAKIDGVKSSISFFKDSSVVTYFNLSNSDKIALLDLSIMNLIIKNELVRNDGKVFLVL